MASVNSTSRPAFVYDLETDSWIPIGVGPHTHSDIGQEVTPLDFITFDGISDRYLPTYQGNQYTISNPWLVLLSINGIIQVVDFPEYVWMSPLSRDGFQVDSDGYLRFSEIPPAGSTFDARIMVGSLTSTKSRQYPFKALDILLGG